MKTRLSKNPSENWLNDAIQFPRLIAELESVGAFTPAVMLALEEAMDLSADDVGSVIDRAQATWDAIKANTKS